MPVSWPTIVDYATGVLNPTRWNKALGDLIKAYIDDQIATKGVPPGGATGDLLVKASATDYDDTWTDSPTVDAITLDTAAAEATGIAKIYWDATEGTVAFGMAGGVVSQQIGRSTFTRGKNTTGSPISRGQVVYLTGASGDRPTIALADASTEATAAYTFGIAAEDIANSAEGEICTAGILANVNTYGLTAGTFTFLSETAGAWTQTKPTPPAHSVRLGIPLKISTTPSGNSGVFYVQINNGYELDELHDVLITSLQAGDLLRRNTGNTLWTNQAPAALTKTDDTNVTLTLGGTPSTALLSATSLTLGWTGTLASTRLNSNVVQAVTNDTNVTGSISTQNLTLGWAGQLSVARGGTGASTLTGYVYGNGTGAFTASTTIPGASITGNISGNAATATALQTARTLWGQSFNGTANVTGTLSSVANLEFSGTANRITANFTTSTIADRAMLQTSTVNGNTNVSLLPNGTATISQIIAYGNSDPTNASYISMLQVGTTESRIQASYSGTGTYTPLTFFTSGVERMRVTSAGLVGIGQPNPTEPLHVVGTTRSTRARVADNDAAGPSFAFQDDTDTGLFRPAADSIGFAAGGTERMRLSGDELWIGYTTDQGAYKLQVNSQIFATNATIATSDARFKTNVRPVQNGLAAIKALRPVSFTWKRHPVHNFITGTDIGFLAQEVQQALGDRPYVTSVVATNGTGAHEFLGMADAKLIPLLVAAVQELAERVDALTLH